MGNPLNINLSVDTTQLAKLATASQEVAANTSAMAERFAQLAGSADLAGNAVMAQAARFMASGLSAQEAAGALLNLGISSAEAATATASVASAAGIEGPALETVAAAATEADVATGSMASRMGMARVELGALSGSTGMVEMGFARMIASSESLAPILSALFVPLAAVAFADVLYQVGEKLYHVYENTVLLKESIAEMNRMGVEEAKRAAELNFQYEESLARRLEAVGRFKDAESESLKAESDKPLALPKIDDKAFKQFNAEFVTFLQAVHTSADAPSVLTRINAEAESTAKQLESAKQRLADLGEVSGEALAYGGGGALLENAQAEVVNLTQKLSVLKTMSGEVQSQIGIDAEQSAARQVEAEKKAEEASERAARADSERAEKAQHTHDVFMNMYKEQFDAYSKLIETEVTLSSRESEMFTKSQEEETVNATRLAEQRANTAAKYVEDYNRIVEASANQQISSEEAVVTASANLEKLKLASRTTSELSRIQITEQINEQELSSLEALENKKTSMRQAALEAQKSEDMAGKSMPAIQFEAAATGDYSQLDKVMKDDQAIESESKRHNAAMAGLARQQAQDAEKAMQEMTQAYMKAFNGVNSSFNTFLGHILAGNERIGVAFQHMGQSIVRSTVQDLAQVALKWAEHFLIVNVLEKNSVIQSLITTVTGNAQKVAVNKTAQESQVLISAGEAGAAAFASVMEALPFPVNIATAPEIASSAVSAAIAVGQAEQGALVPQDMGIFAHAGEMVLPKHISESVQMMAAGTAKGGGGSDVHVHMQNLDGESVKNFINGNMPKFQNALRKAVRNGTKLR